MEPVGGFHGRQDTLDVRTASGAAEFTRRDFIRGGTVSIAAGTIGVRSSRASAQSTKIEQYKVGVVAPISGPASILGKYFAQAVEIETKYLNAAGGVNGIPLKLLIEDDQTSPSLSVVATKKVIQEGIVAICGPVLTNNVLAAIPEIEKAAVPSLCAGAGREVVEPLRKWVFKIPHTDTKVVHLMLKFAKERLHVNRAAVLFQDDASGVSAAKQTKELASHYGISLVAEESCHASDTSMVAQFTKIAKTDAETVLIYVFAGPGAIVAKNAYQVGFKKPLVYYHGAVSESLIRIAGTAAEGTYFVGVKPSVADALPKSDAQKPYIDRFMGRLKEANVRFDTFHGNGHDALNLLAHALKKTPATTTDLVAIRETIRAELEKLRSFPLLNAIYTFTPQDHDGALAEALLMLQVKDGRFVPAT